MPRFRDCFFLCCTLALLLHPGTVPGAPAGEVRDRHREAVTLAREGKMPAALDLLEQLAKTHPLDMEIAGDLIVVLSWDGRYERAWQLYLQREPGHFPGFVHEEILAMLRRQNRGSEALQLLDKLLAIAPDSQIYLLRKAQFLLDAGRTTEAETILALPAAATPDRDTYLRVLAYLHTASGNWAGALAASQQLGDLTAGDPEALRGGVLALQHLAAPSPALEQSSRYPTLFSAPELAALHSLEGALRLRWSGTAARSHCESVLLGLAALHSQLIALNLLESSQSDTVATEGDQTTEMRRRIHYDMVVSLQTIDQPRSVLRLVRQLEQTGEVPAFVLLAAGNAELALKNPQEARKRLETAHRLEPDNPQIIHALFYALIEDEDFPAAFFLVDKAGAATPEFKTFQGSSHRYPNPDALDWQVLAIQGRLYADRLATAWQGIDALLRKAPANSWLLQVGGDVARARGWHHQAEGLYQEALLLDRENILANAWLAANHLAFHEYGKARKLAEDLQVHAPMASATAQTLRDLTLAQRPGLWSDIVFRSTESPDQDGASWNASGELLSVPIHDHLRFSIQNAWAWSDLPVGHESLLRYGGGLEFHNRDGHGAAYLYNNESTVNEIGGLLRATLTPDDHWQFGASGERFARSTPLRALHYGITADSVAGSVSYRFDESRQLAGDLSATFFSDSNTRQSAGVSLRQRMLDIPRFDLDGVLAGSFSHNSEEGTPYFNPASDAEIRTALIAEHILYRRYDNKINQIFEAGLGLYHQEDFSSDWTGQLRYEQRYALFPHLEGVLGFEYGRRVYDGEPEPYYQANALLHVSF